MHSAGPPPVRHGPEWRAAERVEGLKWQDGRYFIDDLFHDGGERRPMSLMSKQDADAYDRLLDAAARLADIIASGDVDIDEDTLEELSIFLAEHGVLVSHILRNLRAVWP